MSLLITFVFLYLTRIYLIDIFGLTIDGVYVCKYKKYEDILFTEKYHLPEIELKAKSKGYFAQVHRGFGEPDSDGSGIHIKASVSDRNYGITMGRSRSSNWKKYYLVHAIADNGCKTSLYVLKKDIEEIFGNIGVESEWVYKEKLDYLYDLPWFELPIM